MLHKRLNVLTNRVRVLRPSERLHKNALALRLLNLLDLVRVSVQLLEEPQGLVWMAVGCLQVVEKVLKRGHARGWLFDLLLIVLVVIDAHVIFIGLKCDRALHIHLFLIIIHFEALRQIANDFGINLSVLLERVILKIEHLE